MRLNLGAGDWRPAGFMSVDIRGADVCHDLAVFPWPFADSAAETVLASHVLEHFDRAGGLRFLEECRRVLAPGGALHLAVPDLDKFIDCRLSGDDAPLGGYAWTDLNDFMGGGAHEPIVYQRHRYMYSWFALYRSLEVAGFRWILRCPAPGPLDNPAYAAISLYVDALP